MTQVKIFIHFRLTQHVSDIIMPIVRRQSNTYIHAVYSARVLTTHYPIQHIQAKTRRGSIQSVSWRWAYWCPKHVEL